MSLVGFREGPAVVDETDIEFIQRRKFNNEWVIEVHLKGRSGQPPYILYRNEDELNVKDCFDMLLKRYTNVELI